PVSAAIGKASGDLLDKLIARFPEDSARQEDDAIGVAVIGRPNVGKSSLVNKLLGEERTLVAPEAGTTRDAIDSQLKYHGAALNFIDTAGLRKKPKVKDDIEFYSRVRTERALDRTGVALLVIDATCGMEGQDLRIAEDVWSRGCGLIVAVNKWDLLEEKDSDTAIRGQRDIAERVQFMDAVPFAYVSALTGQRVRKLLDLIVEVAEQRSRRIPTAEVNRVLEALLARNQPPQKPGKKVNILYGSQVAVDPPTFALVSNRPDVIPESYVRYLNNGFRKAWGFAGSPIRIRLRRKRKRESA
ncbi:MAG: ribosome biogenesis GTPase Der, partial [Gemmatimonadales bacterium]